MMTVTAGGKFDVLKHLLLVRICYLYINRAKRNFINLSIIIVEYEIFGCSKFTRNVSIFTFDTFDQ